MGIQLTLNKGRVPVKVWTADIEQGMDIARRVRTGTYAVNQYSMDFVAPFGGFKASGYGRELGAPGARELTNPKLIWQGA